MSELFCDRLLDAIEYAHAPVCVGIDPILTALPDAVRGRMANSESDIDAAVDAIFDFTTRVLKIVAQHVPIVKFQSAYFEKYYWEGVEAYYSLVQEARDQGLLVIGDVKRGDIGSTAEAYAAAHLAEPPVTDTDDLHIPDAITVNPMLGMDTLAPFVNVAREQEKGLFVLVRTSNPGSAELQDVPLADGRTWSQLLADKVAALADQLGLVGEHGYSSIGAVVGATQAHTITDLRQRLPKSIFLLPGYGTQGGTADMTRAAFKDGKGAIVSASRSILYAHADAKYASRYGKDWEKCVEAAVLDMKQDLVRVLNV